jgi:BlaI family transcriptional regulator, penicillinase repressor
MKAVTQLPRGPLTDLERDVMQVVWESGPCSVEDVFRTVGPQRGLKEATIRTILRRLEQKKMLTHSLQERAYIYRATEPARNLAARAVRSIIDRFCQGSMEELVSGMVEARVLRRDEIERLRAITRSIGADE